MWTIDGPDAMAAERAGVRGVLRLLHHLRVHRRLPATFARELCKVRGTASPEVALEELVGEAIPLDAVDGARMRQAILRVDCHPEGSNADLARKFNLSRRQFQRIRAAAVAAVARRLLAIVDPNSFGARRVRDDVASESRRDRGPSRIGLLQRLRDAVEWGDEIEPPVQGPGLPVPRGLVAAFAAYSHELHGRDHEPDGRDDVRRYDLSTRFELEYLSFLRACDREIVGEAATILRSLQRLAESRDDVTRTLCARLDVSLRRCDGEDLLQEVRRAERLAFESGQQSLRTRVKIIEARILLSCREYAGAADFAREARQFVVPRSRLAASCLRIEAVAALLQHKTWSPPEDIRHACLLDRLAVGMEHARHLLCWGDVDAARAFAEPAYMFANERAYEGLAARAAAILGQIAHRRDSRSDRPWRRLAFLHALRSGDALVAETLFWGQPTTCGLEIDAAAAFCDRIGVIVPDAFGDSPEARANLEAGIAEILRPAAALSPSRSAAIPQGATRARSQLEEAFALVISGVTGQRIDRSRDNAASIFDVLCGERNAMTA